VPGLAFLHGDGWADRVRAAAPGGVDAVFDAADAGLLRDAIDLAGDVDRVITIAEDNFADYGVRFTDANPADRAPEALPELAALMAGGKLTVPHMAQLPTRSGRPGARRPGGTPQPRQDHPAPLTRDRKPPPAREMLPSCAHCGDIHHKGHTITTTQLNV
jgi:hypothetical protein